VCVGSRNDLNPILCCEISKLSETGHEVFCPGHVQSPSWKDEVQLGVNIHKNRLHKLIIGL